MNSRKKQLELIDQLLTIIDELRSKCPWDKKQTFETLRALTIEETHELSDAISEKNFNGIKSELGDLLLHILFYSKIASEKKEFDIGDVAEAICNKLVYRHPHIYGNVNVEDEDEVKRNWESLKLKEGNVSVFSGIPSTLSEMIKSQRIQDKAAGVGFEWKKLEDVWNKVKEEEDEFLEAVKEKNKSCMEEEFGDLIFSLINYARFVKIDPDMALKKTNKKFIERFQYMEKTVKSENNLIQSLNLEELIILWGEAKKNI
jgi:XTP/dITP diphosphohydrolase